MVQPANATTGGAVAVRGGRPPRLARDTGKPVLCTHHLRKKGLQDGEAVTLDRLRGSSATVQTARLVWAEEAAEALLLHLLREGLSAPTCWLRRGCFVCRGLLSRADTLYNK